jgi:hypothetical protein
VVGSVMGLFLGDLLDFVGPNLFGLAD